MFMGRALVLIDICLWNMISGFLSHQDHTNTEGRSFKAKKRIRSLWESTDLSNCLFQIYGIKRDPGRVCQQNLISPTDILQKQQPDRLLHISGAPWIWANMQYHLIMFLPIFSKLPPAGILEESSWSGSFTGGFSRWYGDTESRTGNKYGLM